MNQEDRKELRKVLGLVEGVLFFLLCVTEGGVVLYWLVVNLIAVPAALLGLMRLVSAGRLQTDWGARGTGFPAPGR